ncbi:hypothetical protein AAVH_22017 [Aphelenchoides avenae]|nr:hypothetical protein AAVH_22017 [Aphelenchus avenae]
MSSLPREVLEDVLKLLDRGTLDAVQITNRRFPQLIRDHISDVCFRKVISAYFNAPSEEVDGLLSYYSVQTDDPNGPSWRQVSNKHENATRLFSEFMQLLRSSCVGNCLISQLVFTPDRAAVVLQTPIVCDELILDAASCAELTPIQFHNVVRHFSPTSLDIDRCRLRAYQITDGFLGDLRTNRVRQIVFQNMVPLDGVSFHATDDAIIDFCVQEDVPTFDQEDTCPLRLHQELVVCNGTFTKGLFKRLVQASSVSKRVRPLRIFVSAVRVEDDDLRDFAQLLSHRGRGTPLEVRIYDFPGEQRGAVAAMHMQIVLHPNDKLELIRAQRPSELFHE